MVRALVIAVPLLVLFWIVSIVDCAMQPAHRARGVSKPVWLVIVIVLPVIGGILWFVIGRGRKSREAAAERRAPDDDPAFFRTVGSIADQDERIRRLEEELAQLDAEDVDPRWERPGAAAPDADDEAQDPDGDDRGPRRGAIG